MLGGTIYMDSLGFWGSPGWGIGGSIYSFCCCRQASSRPLNGFYPSGNEFRHFTSMFVDFPSIVLNDCVHESPPALPVALVLLR